MAVDLMDAIKDFVHKGRTALYSIKKTVSQESTSQ